MSKKLTFLFIVTFISAIALGSYLAVQEVRGQIRIGITLNMAGNRIINLGAPLYDTDLITKAYLKALPELFIDGDRIDGWCDVQYFTWCSGAPDPYPEPPEGPVCGDMNCEPEEECEQPEYCKPDCGICPF